MEAAEHRNYPAAVYVAAFALALVVGGAQAFVALPQAQEQVASVAAIVLPVSNLIFYVGFAVLFAMTQRLSAWKAAAFAIANIVIFFGFGAIVAVGVGLLVRAGLSFAEVGAVTGLATALVAIAIHFLIAAILGALARATLWPFVWAAALLGWSILSRVAAGLIPVPIDPAPILVISFVLTRLLTAGLLLALYEPMRAPSPA